MEGAGCAGGVLMLACAALRAMSEGEARRALSAARVRFDEAHAAFEAALARREGVKEAIRGLIEAEAALRAAKEALGGAGRRGRPGKERDGLG